MNNTNLSLLKILARVHNFGYLVILHPILLNLLKRPSYYYKYYYYSYII